ncbi:uncharacterized protein LOC111636271 [Centruroides sculpturatus]|uniref:uncharacterized protein LOC111636271 n=1 Tax=Centruroides sculpturatus TaxID=218467 RepID=UPI000C6E3579|nr:uncharacterized protein LOC111636271 [Centruroides sculpturatus]
MEKSGEYLGDNLLIQAIQEFPFIYDKSHTDFKDIKKKSNSWKTVAETVQLTVSEAQARWKLLRERFGKEDRRYTPSGSGKASQPVWPLYQSMMFLKNIVKHRKTRSNYAPSTDVEALHESTSVLHGDADTSPWNTLDTLTRDVSVCEQDDICDGVATYCDGPSTSVGDISTHLTNMKRKKKQQKLIMLN